jgi:hypothetical protein
MQLSTIPALMTTDPRAVREVIRQAARHGPSAVEEGTGLVYILGYADIRRVLNDKNLNGAQLALFDLVGLTEGPLRDWRGYKQMGRATWSSCYTMCRCM